MVTVGVRGGQPLHRQLLRGVGFTVGLLGGLYLAGYLFVWLQDGDGFVELSTPRRFAVVATWAGIVTALAFTWRRLRRWSERPRWLVPAAAVIAAVGLVPAVLMRAPVRPAYISHCIPVADAWRPVMAPSSAADLAFVAAHPKPAHPPLDTMTRQQRDAYTVAFNAWALAPAAVRVEERTLWGYGAGACAAPSRTHLGWSAAGLGVGAAALIVAVRRRRTDLPGRESA